MGKMNKVTNNTQQRLVDYGSGRKNMVDFSDEEIERRVTETFRRACGQPATFSLETGQPLKGTKLSNAELKRRGYDYYE